MGNPDILDNGGRRLGIDRRLFSIRNKKRERRCQRERRTGKDRRYDFAFDEDSPEERRRLFHIILT